jgi:hypothetical protein
MIEYVQKIDSFKVMVPEPVAETQAENESPTQQTASTENTTVNPVGAQRSPVEQDLWTIPFTVIWAPSGRYDL